MSIIAKEDKARASVLWGIHSYPPPLFFGGGGSASELKKQKKKHGEYVKMGILLWKIFTWIVF